MNGKRVSLISRRSFFTQRKPRDRLSRTQSTSMTSHGMSWSAMAHSPPPGVRMPPGFGIPEEPPQLPADPPDPDHPKTPEEYPAKLSLKLEPEDRDTDLARLCSDPLHELPQLVKVGESFSLPGDDLKVDKGDSLLLLFIAELPRVHAVDMSDGSELWLPVNAEQVYERLPLDPRLDDKLYMGATKLINAKPMPSMVRVVEGYGSDDYTECVDNEDIIRISHIEENSSRHDTQKTLIAQNQIGHRLELHKGMECAHFTTMLSSLFLYMSQLVDLEFPQRVRVVEEIIFEKRQPKEEKVLKLLSFKKDHQVIATRAKKPGFLSIPITVPLKVSTAALKEKTFQTCLPALFPSINLTWGPKEFGRPELPEQQRERSQPLPEPLRAWLVSFEGKERVCEVAKVSKEDLVRDLKELTNYNKDLADRIAFLSQSERPFIPTRDKSRAPPRPSKPFALRRVPPPPLETPKPSLSPQPSLSPKPGMFPKPKPRKISTPHLEKKKVSKFEPSTCSGGKDSYEIPNPKASISDDGEDADYEVISDLDIAKKDPGTLEGTCAELKRILEQKEKKITKLREQNEELQEICKTLEKEKELIRQSGLKHVEEIHRLQSEVDQLASKNDEDIYDIIGPTERSLPTLPASGGDSVIYNTPDALLVERALMPRTDKEGVADILRQLGLSRYVDKFKEEGVHGALLVSLDETVLKEDLGMTGLHARKLLLEVKKHVK